MQLRIIAGVALLSALLATTYRFWLPLLHWASGPVHQPVSGPRPRDIRPLQEDPAAGIHGAKGDPANPTGGTGALPLVHDSWTLTLDDGRSLSVFDGLRIAADDIHRGAGKTPYARVQREDKVLKLVNLSGDTWTATPVAGGAKHTYRQNERLTLNNNFQITFGKLASGTLLLDQVARRESASGETH
jgi:hypothetical protein